MLKGIKPKQIEKRLKAFFFGAAGVGKTTAAIQFPRPYLIDTERGAENDQYIDLLDKQGGLIFQTNEFEEIINEIQALRTEKHPYKTLIIDPLTTIYSKLVYKAERDFMEAHGKESGHGQQYDKAGKQIKYLCDQLLKLDMNVIITSHSKEKYVKNDKGVSEIVGNTFDCYKKMDYLFDVVFEVQKRGGELIGIVTKTRITNFKDREQFPFNYQTIAEKYGKNILERDAIVEKLSTSEQREELSNLSEILKIPRTTITKWLDKYNVERFEDMTFDEIQKIIDAAKEKIKTKQPIQENK